VARKRNLIPSYLHHTSGKARAVWTDALGVRQFRMFPGPHGSKEYLEAFGRLQLEIATSPAVAVADLDGITVNEVLAAYYEHADRYYADEHGKPTKELGCMKAATKPVRELYGETPAGQFGPVALKAVRQCMVNAGLCRTLVNRRADRIKRVFKWAASEELIPVSVYESLRTLAGLRRGKTDARESKPVKPVADAVVEATLPHLPPHVRGIIEVMRHTGMRPTEVCRMTLGQIDRTGDTWVYRPMTHKTAHHGKTRAVPLGPNARAVIIAHLRGRSLDPNEPLFSPRRQRDERFAAMRGNRKTPVQPSQVDRKKPKPKKMPREHYSQESITHAVSTAAKKANVEHWHPYQLRHAYGTKVRKEHGLEAAQVLLGHSRADVTQVYAQRNEELAATVAAKIG
jgi:integrase